MIFKALVLFSIVMPLFGIIQIENGSFAWGVNQSGEKNGATFAFTFYSALMLASLFATTKGTFFRLKENFIHNNKFIKNHSTAFKLILFINIFFAITLLFGLGGYKTLLGTVGKGEFRTTLGGLGAVAYLITKWLAPALFAYLCAISFMLKQSNKTTQRLTFLLFANGTLVFLVGISWGFKTTGILMLTPGFIILTWNSSIKTLLTAALLASATIYTMFLIFDTTENTIYATGIEFIWARLTVLQGEVAWFLWGEHLNNNLDYNYLKTLTVFVGDRIWSILTGITRENQEQWVLYHFGSLLTYASGYPIEGIFDGHSVTGTPFSEGLIAGGVFGLIFFGIIAGIITGIAFNQLRKSIRTQDPMRTALWSCYFVFCVFTWLIGGEIVQLFHISVFVSILLSWSLIRAIKSLCNVKIFHYESIKK